MKQTWKLLAILGVTNLVAGLAVVGVGLAYDFFRITPGTISMIGVGLMGAPWLGLSRHLYVQLQKEHAKQAKELGDHPRDTIRQLSSTGTHRTIQAMIDEHGAEEIFGILADGRGIPPGLGGGMGREGGKQ